MGSTGTGVETDGSLQPCVSHHGIGCKSEHCDTSVGNADTFRNARFLVDSNEHIANLLRTEERADRLVNVRCPYYRNGHRNGTIARIGACRKALDQPEGVQPQHWLFSTRNVETRACAVDHSFLYRVSVHQQMDRVADESIYDDDHPAASGHICHRDGTVAGAEFSPLLWSPRSHSSDSEYATVQSSYRQLFAALVRPPNRQVDS
jgi:hypothetical protein